MNRFRALLVALLALVVSACAHQGSVKDDAVAAGNCQPVTEQDVKDLFARWNDSLLGGNAREVVANYAAESILLPTVENGPLLSAEEKEKYFLEFLKNRPAGVVTRRMIQRGCNSAFDSGLYTFTYRTSGKEVKARYTYTYAWNGTKWLITSHHSSALPKG